MTATLEAGRDAMARHDWTEAVEALTEAEREKALSGEDLELLGSAMSGRGVHVAARIGAAAEREEILASTDTIDAAGPSRFTLSEPRTLTLKGVVEPVEVRAVARR